MDSIQKVAVMGLGLMGSALTNRLIHLKESKTIPIEKIVVWNRTSSKAKPFEEKGCDVAESVSSALNCCKDPLILCMFATYDQTQAVLLEDGENRELIKGKRIVSLCSGTPDDARALGEKLIEAGVSYYIDGCYAGSPSVLEKGEGHMMLSSQPKDPLLQSGQILHQLFCGLGEVTITDRLGSNKALDYAIVDTFFSAYICYLSGLSMIEQEGIAPEVLLSAMKNRYPKFAPQFEETMEKMDRKEYDQDIVASLKTWQQFFDGRMDYLKAHNLNPVYPSFMSSLCNQAADGNGDHDFTKLQEILRFNNPNLKK